MAQLIVTSRINKWIIACTVMSRHIILIIVSCWQACMGDEICMHFLNSPTIRDRHAENVITTVVC